MHPTCFMTFLNHFIFSNKIIRICFVFALIPLGCFAQFYDCEEELFSRKDKATRLFGYINMLGEYRIPPVFLKASPFVGKNAIVQQGKKFGVINCEGILAVPAEYDEIASFSNEKGWMRAGNLWGLVDAKGRRLIAPMYEEVKEANALNGTVTWVKKSGLWGLISKENGRMLVQPTYENISNLSDSAGIARKGATQDLVYYGDGRVIIQGMRRVQRLTPELFSYQSSEKKFGAFNSLAYIMIRPTWDSLFMNGPLVQVVRANMNGLQSVRGVEVAPTDFIAIEPSQYGVYIARSAKGIIAIDTRNQTVSPPGFWDQIEIVNNDLLVIEKKPNSGIWNHKEKKWELPLVNQKITKASSGMWLRVVKDGQVTAYIVSKNQFSATKWDSIESSSGNTLIIAYKAGATYITSYPDFVEKESFTYAKVINGKYAIAQKNGYFGTLTHAESIGLNFEYEAIEPLPSETHQICKIRKGGVSGIATVAGKILVIPQYEDIANTTERLYMARKLGKWGLVDASGIWIASAVYDSITSPKLKDRLPDFPLVAWRKGKSQLIDSKGKIISEATRTNWIYLNEGMWTAHAEGKYKLVNGSGATQGETLYDSIRTFSMSKAEACVGGKWGYINYYGKMVIPATFEAVLPFRNGVAFARSQNKWGVLRPNGSWLVKPIGIGVEESKETGRKLILP